jgi:hypothetical protein
MARLSLSRPWTSEDEALLAQLLEQGKTWAEVSVRLRRSTAAIQHHVRERRAFRVLGTDTTKTGMVRNGPQISSALVDHKKPCFPGRARAMIKLGAG